MLEQIKQHYTDYITLSCTFSQAQKLLPYDHHSIKVQGKIGVLITYHLMGMEHNELNQVLVVFVFAEKHPQAPPEIQEVVDELNGNV